MPFITLSGSPLNPDSRPVEIYYRASGTGLPLVFLHGGWGYEIYPFDDQIKAFGDKFRILIPDRSGYGRSRKIAELPADFHHRAAVETALLLDALDIQSPVVWGHSDGAVIAALLALLDRRPVRGLILEAFHFFRAKPRSREFFETMFSAPERLGRRVSETLAREHGERYWRELIQMNGRAWLKIAAESRLPGEDLYSGKLGEINVPAIFIHGANDPRTEPGEMEAVQRSLPRVLVHLLPGAGHSPHSERAAVADCNRVAAEFLESVMLD